jgi:two-component system chemotaxis response regulator CheY
MSFSVLIVDDSCTMRAVIKKIVTLSGFKMSLCLEAGNGREALEQLKKNWVDVIISDLNMPEMNGVQLLQELSQDTLYKNIPVIIVSTDGSREWIVEVKRKGAKGFITKPFQSEEIRKVLHEVIGVGADGEYQEDRPNTEEGDF